MSFLNPPTLITLVKHQRRCIWSTVNHPTCLRLEHESADSFLNWLQQTNHDSPPMVFGTLWGHEEETWASVIIYFVCPLSLSGENHELPARKCFVQLVGLSTGAGAGCGNCRRCELVEALESWKILTRLQHVFIHGKLPLNEWNFLCIFVQTLFQADRPLEGQGCLQQSPGSSCDGGRGRWDPKWFCRLFFATKNHLFITPEMELGLKKDSLVSRKIFQPQHGESTVASTCTSIEIETT